MLRIFKRAGLVLALSVPIFAQTQASSPTHFGCDQSAAISAVGAATVQLVALTAGQTIYVCAFVMTASVAGTAQYKYGTGTTCGTGTTNITGAMNFPANGPLSSPGTPGFQFKTAAANALCITGTGTSQSINGYVSYSKF